MKHYNYKTIEELEEGIKFCTEQMKIHKRGSKEYQNASAYKSKYKKMLSKLNEREKLLADLISKGNVLKRVSKYASHNDLLATYAYRLKERDHIRALYGVTSTEYRVKSLNINKLKRKLIKIASERIDNLSQEITLLESSQI